LLIRCFLFCAAKVRKKEKFPKKIKNNLKISGTFIEKSYNQKLK